MGVLKRRRRPGLPPLSDEQILCIELRKLRRALMEVMVFAASHTLPEDTAARVAEATFTLSVVDRAVSSGRWPKALAAELKTLKKQVKDLQERCKVVKET